MPQDYNKTLNLPKTKFPMRGNLQQREPEVLDKWEKERSYYHLVDKNKDKPKYILHDGPPYANGDIHLGTALNKILKDIVVKSKAMSGYNAVYVPGWDTHGLPIELKALKKIGVKSGAIDHLDLRRHCKEYALSYVKDQTKQFKRLGVWGDFDDPYLTLKPDFEAKQVEIFGEMAKKDYIYKGLRPVYWCAECETALAEAEIEYDDDPCDSIYVKFKITDDKGLLDGTDIDKDNAYIVIWTTTTWTLPGNMAICFGPEYEYTFVKVGNEYLLMAKDLVEITMSAAGISEYEQIGTFMGSELEFIESAHPFLDRVSIGILGDHVTLESGTGCVHTAPGHGQEDFDVWKNAYKRKDIVVPVDDKGILTEDAGQFSGLSTQQANKAIVEKLESTGNLLAIEKINHQYPHCWRCNEPIIYRATEQWFCSIEDFKEETIKAVEDVKWIPAWGEERIKGMVRDRDDWCISRQRTWGVPIPIIYCDDCGKMIINDETITAISNLFREKGSDAWLTHDTSEFIPSSVKCECGGTTFTKENDIMDVWFDSGCTHAAVLDQRENLEWPCDLYLEGTDQYRGWFQSSLLTSVAWRGSAPYKAVCVHGMVVDGDGKKMSKSLGNGILPEEIIKDYGADILRLWVSSADYHSDIRISKDILKQLTEAYRKIRNTARFILGNLSNANGFNPDTDMVSDSELFEIDKVALMKLDELIEKVSKAYDDFDFHIVFHAIHNFCVTDMSNFYLDIIKDRLYCENENSLTRKAAQTTIYRVIDALTRLITPILAYTSDEIWRHMPHKSEDDVRGPIFNDMPQKSGITFDDAFTAKWETIYELREDAKKALEIKRAEKVIGSSLEAKLTLHCSDKLYDFALENAQQLADIFIVSALEVKNDGEGDFTGEIENLSITVQKADGDKCERCWIYSTSVGESAEHPTLCDRCVGVLEE